MVASIDLDSLDNGDDVRQKETCIIPAGFNVCRLVSYVEMGHHIPVFMGKQQMYDQGKRTGQIKDPELVIRLVFEFTNAAHTGDYPLTLATSCPFGTQGDLLNKLAMSKGIEEGWASKSSALKQNYVKTLLAMRDATNTTYTSLADYVGTVFGINITHSQGKKVNEDGSVPSYANMKVVNLVAPKFTNPVTQEETVITLPDALGDYCSVFDWEKPTVDAWAKLPKYIKDYIMTAEDFQGSPLNLMIIGVQANDTGYGNTDAPSTMDNAAPATPSKETIDDDIPF